MCANLRCGETAGVWHFVCVCVHPAHTNECVSVQTYRNAGLRHGDAVWVHRGLHTLVEGRSEAIRLICTLTPVPLGAAEHKESDRQTDRGY